MFLFGEKDTGITEEQVVQIPEFTGNILSEMLVKIENGNPAGGWIWTYYADRPNWMKCVEEITGELYTKLLKPVHERVNKP